MELWALKRLCDETQPRLPLATGRAMAGGSGCRVNENSRMHSKRLPRERPSMSTGPD